MLSSWGLSAVHGIMEQSNLIQSWYEAAAQL